MGIQNVSYIPQLRKLGIKGHTLIEVVVAGALSMILMAGVSSLLEIMATQQRRSNVLDKTQQLVASITSMIEDDTAWNNTVAHAINTNLACLQSHVGNCTLTSGGSFNLYDRNGELLIEALNNTSGFAPSGPNCDTFSTSGNSQCPLHVNLTWEPLCTTCHANQLKVNVEIIFAPLSDSKIPGFTRNFSLLKNMTVGPFIATKVGVGFNFTCAVVNGGVQCWGANWNRALGQPASVGYKTTPVKVAGLESGVTDLAVGMYHSCAIQNGNVKCWGANGSGRSGVGGASIQVPNIIVDAVGAPLTNVTDIDAGFVHSCAVAGGAAYCWGSNGSGQLGTSEAVGLLHNQWSGHAFARQVLDMGTGVVSISTTLSMTCAVKNDGSLMCWGHNDQRGGLGQHYTGRRQLGTDPPDGSYKVCWPFIIEGTVLPRQALDASGFPIWNTSSNPGLNQGFFWAPPGAGPFLPPLAPVPPLTVNERIQRCNPRPVLHDSFLPGDGSVDIEGGCVLKDTGKVECWGYNYGALGQGPAYGGSSQPPWPYASCPGCPSQNNVSRAFEVINLSNVTMLGAIAGGACAITGGRLYCWGWNSNENHLGTPTGAPGSNPTPRQVGIPGTVTYFRGGSDDEAHHSCAIANEKVYCWGKNDRGQLGNGTLRDRTRSYVEVKRFR